MNLIGTLILKDIKLFFRNQFFAVVTILGLVAYLVMYFLLPANPDEAFNIAIYVENPADTTIDETFADFFDYTLFTSQEEMKTALQENGEYFVGLSIPTEQALAITKGTPTTVDVFFAPDIPIEIKEGYDDLLAILVNSANPLLGNRFSQIEETSTVLGNDIYGNNITARDRIIPMLLLFLLAVEIIGLATLIAQEVERGTARALVTSPLRLGQFFAGKAGMGLLLAFTQSLILIAATGKITTSPLLLLTTLLLGAFMITGFGFMVAAISKDAMTVMGWGVLLIIFLAIPALAVMLPGLATAWAQIIPSFYLVDALHQILNFGAGWADVAGNLFALFMIGTVTLTTGSFLLQRRF